MDYSTYTAEDFIADESFQAFVFNTDTEHVAYWQTWIARHPEKEYLVDQAIEILKVFKTSQKKPSGVDKQLELEKLLQKTRPQQFVVYHNPDSGRKHWNFASRIAAAFIGILLIAAGYFIMNDYLQTTRLSTHYGETKQITLPDGSTVVLNANSKIRYASHWDNKEREVWLEGEAFFSVRKKNSTPATAASTTPVKFIVHTHDLDVEVLGTEFTVSKRNIATQVTLNSGKIKLGLHTKKEIEPILMQPGEQVVFSSEKEQLLQTRVKPELYSSWARQVWILENTPLSRVAQMIEETFGMDVIIEDKEGIAQEKMTGVVPTKNIDELLEGMSTIYQLNITRKGDTIKFKK
jgi:ferric-dicitrate binding protein FerR (iron transport regulator)